MPDYRRNRVPGGTYFFTVNLLDRKSHLLTEQIDALRQAVRRTMQLMPIHVDAWVILPDHMHTVWTLPEGDTAFAARWQAIKSAFTKTIPPGEALSQSRQSRGERGIWQRRFREHTIRDERDYAAHVNTSTSTPSSMASFPERPTGRSPRSAAAPPPACIRRGRPPLTRQPPHGESGRKSRNRCGTWCNQADCTLQVES